MSAINYAVREVINRMPSQVLERLFGKVRGFECNFNPATIEDSIRNTIIYNRVITDMNLYGGLERYINVQGAEIINSDETGTLYHYTEKQLHGLSIISAHYYMPGTPPRDEMYSILRHGGGNSTPRGGGMNKPKLSCPSQKALEQLASDVNPDKHKVIGFGARVIIRLVGKNSILSSSRAKNGYFKVVLSEDPELTTVPPRSYPAFAKLVELATKAYIYKEEVITLEQAEIYNGASLGGIKSYISDLRDSEELYQAQLKKWGKIAFMHDRPAYARFLRGQISPHGLS